MSLNIIQVKLFNKFVDDIFAVLVTIDATFKVQRGYYTQLRQADEKAPVTLFKSVLTTEVRDYILNKNDELFTSATDTQIADLDWATVFHTIGVHWSAEGVSNNNKRIIWIFLQSLMATSDRCLV